MEGSGENIIKNDSNLLSRNSPTALIVGAGGFLGSHLADKLLSKNIQIIGIDNFSTGSRENLKEAVKDKRFHLVDANAGDIKIDPPRLDYIFIAAGEGWEVDKILDLAKQFSSKVVFTSSIGLYDRNPESSLGWYKKAEAEIAKYATENKLNARVVRLGAVYGPRMHFREDDPATRLIQAALLGDLQKESTALEFSTRAIFVDDAVDLIIKSTLSGSTAQKIFDGVSDPVKVSEVKQILIDPVWHESRGFGPSALPPWSTPNLSRTKSTLSWKPQTNLVQGLKETLHYFKESGIDVPRPSAPPFKMEQGWKEKIDEFKKEEPVAAGGPEKKKKLALKSQTAAVLIVIIFIFTGLIYPMFGLSWNVVAFRMNLGEIEDSLGQGKISESLRNLSEAKANLIFLQDLSNSFNFTLDMGALGEYLSKKRAMIRFYNTMIGSAEESLEGVRVLSDSFKIISGERAGDLKKESDSAGLKLEGGSLALTELNLELKNKSENLPLIKVEDILRISAGAQVLAKLLPQVIPARGTKSYLVVFEDSGQLWPTGGRLETFVRVDFEDGKLKKIEAEDLKSLEKNLTSTIEPPKDLKKDLNLTGWTLTTSNFEPDFPTSARQIIWFYEKGSGRKIDGVLTLDSKALQNLLTIIGHDKEDAGPVEFLNKIFFLPDLNWPQIITVFGKSFEEKHINVYFADSKLFSYLSAEGFIGGMSRPQDQPTDFLFPVETNVGGNKANNFIDRRYNLETNIDDLGRVGHSLRIGYINGGQQPYKNRMRIYLPAGTKLTRASWGESELLKEAASFTEYDRGGYSIYFEVAPKEQKSLILEYLTLIKLNIKTPGAKYILEVSKQAGTDRDPFTWTLKGVKKQTVNTDLLKDRRFEVNF